MSQTPRPVDPGDWSFPTAPPESVPPIPAGRIPELSGTHHLSPKMISVWRAHALIALAILIAVTIGFAAVLQGTWWTVLIVAAVAEVIIGGATAWILPRLEWDRWSFEIGDDELDLRHGILTRHRSTVPYYRLQHIDITSGPIERALGVSKLVVRTAAATTDAALPGIPADQATGLRDVILDRAGHGDAV